MNFDQNNRLTFTVQDNNENSDLLESVVSGDETGVCGNDVDTKTQSSHCKWSEEPRSKKARKIRTNVKVLLFVFLLQFSNNSCQKNLTVIKKYYVDVMHRSREEFEKNARICGETVNGFCFKTTYRCS